MLASGETIMKNAAKAAKHLSSREAKKAITSSVKKAVSGRKYVGRGFFFSIPALIAGATALGKAAAGGAASAVGGHLASKALKGRGLYTGREHKGRGLYTRASRQKAFKSVKAAGRSFGRFAVRGARTVGRITKDSALQAAKAYVAREGPAALLDIMGSAYGAYR
tara:strand:+ start:250 stop:744 length:495 start_codon:yes stop_codon:yes gene_type:complete